jgi:hypothetical protein
MQYNVIQKAYLCLYIFEPDQVENHTDVYGIGWETAVMELATMAYGVRCLGMAD